MKNIRSSLLPQSCLFALLLLSIASASAQVSWQRQAYGQGPFYYPGHQGDPLYAIYYPNNNNWSQQLTFAYDNSNPPKPIVETAPSNWSTDTFPKSGDVTLGNGGVGQNNAPTNYDRGATPVSLTSLTVQADGGLNLEFGTTMTANLFNLQGNNNADATLTVSGGGGAWPVLNLPAGGTMKKTTGTSSFMLDPGIVLQVLNGGTIAADAGALQLPGNATSYSGGIRFDAATGAIIDLAPSGAVDSGVVRVTGAFTGINTGGTVRLSKGWLSTVGGTGGATLNFAGNTFQWSGGSFQSQAPDSFVNLGTINITGPVNPRGLGFRNQGTVTQSGAGLLNIPAGGGFTNAAGSTFDLRNDNGLISEGGGGATGFFRNAGTLRKSAGTGTSTLNYALAVDSSGVIRVDSGTLALGSGLVTDGGTGDGGIFQVAAGATLALTDGTHNSLYTGTYTGSGGGIVSFSGGSLEAVRSGSGAIFNLPPGMFQWTGGTTVTNVGTPFVNAGSLTIAGPVGCYNYGARFTNQGVIIQTGDGSMSPGRDGIINAAGGTYDIRNDLGYIGGYRLTNAGILQKSAGTGTSVIDAQAFENSGTVRVSSGTLQITQLLQTDGVIDLNGGTIASQNEIVLDGGMLAGSGDVNASVRNTGGIVGPGHSPGKLTINGNYTQGANGTLNIEIGGNTAGTGYDQLVVNGAATLGGTLNISTINGYRPAVGDVFTIISPQSFTGSFAQINATGLSVQANYASGAITVTVTSVPDLLLNISTRLRVLTEDKALIGGFIITGTEPKKVIIRAIGPSLNGVPGALQDPTLELFADNTSLATNDDWRQNQETEIQASGVAPSKDAEAAIIRTLNPGNYTAVVRGKNNSVGIGVVEVYDLAQAAQAKLANISSRGFVDTGDNALIGGFIAGGSGGGTTTKVVIRALGPSLGDAGVAGSLANPTVQLINANGSTVRANDDWKSDQQAQLEAIGIQPKNDVEAALVETLPAGNYTAVVRGKGDTTGIGLVEVYNVP